MNFFRNQKTYEAFFNGVVLIYRLLISHQPSFCVFEDAFLVRK